jgi:hypothetical protein
MHIIGPMRLFQKLVSDPVVKLCVISNMHWGFNTTLQDLSLAASLTVHLYMSLIQSTHRETYLKYSWSIIRTHMVVDEEYLQGAAKVLKYNA